MEHRTSLAQRRQLAELQKPPNSLTEVKGLHIFSIENDENIQDIWHRIRDSSKDQTGARISDIVVAAHTPDKLLKARKMEDLPHTANGTKNVDSLRGLEFEDYRTHCFNTINPTRVSAPQEPLDLHNENIMKARIREDSDISTLNQNNVLIKDQATTQKQEHKKTFVTANLTLEGKRQAQLAGEKFRARGLYYRPRKMSTGPTDRQNYHNRWAMYTSAEKPEVVRAVLTPDAKRQVSHALN